MPLRAVSLEDRYTLEEGTVFLTGVQALVRLPLDQARRDRRAGLRTGTVISGYPGSPLGGYDLELERVARLLRPHDIVHIPGVNEETGAAIAWGSQLLDLFPHSRFDGVTGIWYGKSPGVDRCGDIFRHGNYGGGPRHCALIALAGDDPSAKSSTLPNASEWAFVNCGMPVLYPATVAEMLELGLHAIAMSRFAGLWVGFKTVTNLCDGAATVHVSPDWPETVYPEATIDGRRFRKPHSAIFLPPGSQELERSLYEERLLAAQAYARANRLDRAIVAHRHDRVGIVAAGKTFSDLWQALADLGLDEEELAALGVRLLKLSLIYPLDPQTVREFARGLEEVVVIEEKRELIEGQVKSALYGLPDAPRVVGKRDERDQPLFPSFGELDADAIAERLGPRLLRLAPSHPGIERRLRELAEVRQRPQPSVPSRLPNYCSGCPHSRSTLMPGEEVVGGGIGCHGMGGLMSQKERQVSWLTPMGAEGAPWIGIAPFVDREHLFQNLGDGTFFHSGSQSLRNAVAAGANMTFKILYNGHVSMTGGQAITGGRDVATLTRLLEAEGVARTIVVSEEPRRYRRARLAGNAKVYHRDRYEEAVRELKRTRGVTVLIYDQECAAEKRRARKRGRLPEPTKHVFINEDVCEGCGDCGYKSNCMSVRPIETEFGRKTQIHQPSCNKDYSCLQGDCPSFLTVYTRPGARRTPARSLPPLDPARIPDPTPRAGLNGPYRIYMPGIGGTGVVTTNQVLAYAALMEGKEALALDQTGLAQKGGAVLSSLTISREPLAYASNKVGLGQADLLLALDILGAANKVNLDRCWPGRTTVVGNTDREPIAEEIRHMEVAGPSADVLRSIIDAYSRPQDNIWVAAGHLAERLLGDQTKVNTFLVGVAYQAGLIPLHHESIEAAYRLNGVDVEENLQAFRYGRLYYHDPAQVERLLGEERRGLQEEIDYSLGQLGHRSPRGRAYLALLERCAHLDEESRRLLAVRLRELVLYQDAAYAGRYLERVLQVARREEEAAPGRRELTHAVIRYLYKLMAYKDEYEVARLLLREEWRRRVEEEFGPGARVRFNLHPPLLRALGLRRKLELGGWARPLLRLLVALRRLRGSRLDPFGRMEVRRQERALIGWYESLLDELLAGLRTDNHALAVELASSPDRIRGYESLKLRRIQETKESVAAKLAEFRGAAAPEART